MTDDNIIRIHPELKDVENRPQTILETSLKEREFHNPFSSRKEYKKRETAFIQEQANLAARMGTSFEDMEKNDHILDMPNSAWQYIFGINIIVNLHIAEYVFGEDFFDKCEREFYNSKNEEICQKMRARQFLFFPDQLFFQNGLEPEQDTYDRAAAIIQKSSLSREQIQTYAQRAFELYDIYSFADIHYEKRLIRINPLDDVLNDLIALVCKLDSTKLPDLSQIGTVIDFVNENGKYVNEEGSHYTGIEIKTKEDKIITLPNCWHMFHKDLIHPGTKLRYIQEREYNPDPDHKSYRAIDLIQ